MRSGLWTMSTVAGLRTIAWDIWRYLIHVPHVPTFSSSNTRRHVDMSRGCHRMSWIRGPRFQRPVFGSKIIQHPTSNIQGNVPQNLATPVTVVFATPRDSRPGGKGGKDGKGGGMKAAWQ